MDKKVLKKLSYGMYVIGAKDEKDVGCIVNTLVQITSDCPTIAVSLNKNNYTTEVIKKTKKFSVSILDESTNPKIIGTFGYSSSRETDKYENVETLEIDELKVLKESCGVMICEVINQMETSTHIVFLAKIVKMENHKETNPMTYRYYQQVLKGKSPKNAPTYVEEQETKKTVYRCSICGYEIETDELPDDFKCPLCGQPKEVFVKIEKE